MATGIDPIQFTSLIVRPALAFIGLHNESAVQLLVGTATQESGLGRYLGQLGNGPARGVFQIEPATHRDVWRNFLKYRAGLAGKVGALDSGAQTPGGESLSLIGNLHYQAAIARVIYLRAPEPLPRPGDVDGMARLWKLRYNTPAGRGTEAEFIRNFPMEILR